MVDLYGTETGLPSTGEPAAESKSGGFLGPLLGILSLAAMAKRGKRGGAAGGGLLSQFMAQQAAEDAAMRQNNEYTRRQQIATAQNLIQEAARSGIPLADFQKTDLGRLSTATGLPIGGAMALATEQMRKGITDDITALAPYGDVSSLANAGTNSEIAQIMASPQMQEILRKQGLGTNALKLTGDIRTMQGLSTRPDPKGAISGLYDDPSMTLGEISLGQKGWEGLLQKNDLEKLNTQAENARRLEALQHGNKMSELGYAASLRNNGGGGNGKKGKDTTSYTLKGLVTSAFKQVDDLLKDAGKDRQPKLDPKSGKPIIGADGRPVYEPGPDRITLLKQVLETNYKLSRALDVDKTTDWNTIDTALEEAFGVRLGSRSQTQQAPAGSPFGNLSLDPRVGRMAQGGDSLDKVLADLAARGGAGSQQGNLSGLLQGANEKRSGGREAPPGSLSAGRKGVTSDKYNQMRSYYQNMPGLSQQQRQEYLKELDSKYYVIKQ